MNKEVKVYNKGKGTINASKEIKPGRYATIPEDEANKLSKMYPGLNIVSDANLETANKGKQEAEAKAEKLQAEVNVLKSQAGQVKIKVSDLEKEAEGLRSDNKKLLADLEEIKKSKKKRNN